MKSDPKWWYGIAFVSAVALVFDRVAKIWFIQHPEDTIAVWNPYLVLHYHLNTDMALSIPLLPWLYYPLIVIVFAALLYTLFISLRNQRLAEFSCILIVLVGAVSNLVDRILYNGVIDFVSLWLGNVFNIADIYIVGGIIGWCIVTLRHDQKHTDKTQASA